MRKFALPTALLGTALACLLLAHPAQAQTRVFVAAQGSDSNPCSFAQPCRTFQHAHDTVAAGGEIDVLDPAGYGAFTITKSISVQGHGFSGISVGSGAAGITINGAATNVVYLSGLIIDGGGVGHNGIQLAAGKSLTIQNCAIRNMTNRGIEFAPSAASALAVSNTLVADNGGRGIIIVSSGSLGFVQATLTRVEAYNNVIAGITLDNSNGSSQSQAVVTDSVAANNGVGISTLASGLGFIVVIRSTVTGNGTGLLAGLGSAIFITESNVVGNATGYSGDVASAGDNTTLANQAGPVATGQFSKN